MLLDNLTLGVCYYPEHWPESLWADDLRRMKAHGISVVRVAEFCWCLFEPQEGVYKFDLFDRFLILCQKEKMQVIFCTPTATPPAWLTEKYPESLNAHADGTLMRHGLRRHYNYNAPAYRCLTERIVKQLGAHYGDSPVIIGWQIDNELNCETNEFHSEADHTAFRTYMKNKYRSLDNLNEKMGSVVWSQDYSDWNQLYLRRPTVNGQFNPHIHLEEKQFFSESAVSYCRLQTEALRPYIGARFITTNGLFGHIDYERLVGTSLDFLCYDCYPNFALDMSQPRNNPDDIKDRHSSQGLAITRALSSRFGVMEQQSGANGWTGRMEAPMPRPGQMRLWALQSLAHGADFISFFRWRTAPFGTEIYWHGILDYDNRDNRRLKELFAIAKDVKKLAVVAGSPYIAKVAIARDYLNEWDASLDVWHGRVNLASEEGLFRACQHTHTPVDYLYLSQDTSLEILNAYKLIFYPHATILEEPLKEKLVAYVENGGTLVFGARTGYKDSYGRCPMRNLSGLAGELTGAGITDYTFIGPDDEPGSAKWGDTPLDAPVFNDVLETLTPSARVEATYTANYYQGQPALISDGIGTGRAYYFGAAFSEDAATVFLKKLGCISPYENEMTLSPSLELAARGKYRFILNYMRAPQPIHIKKPMLDLITGEKKQGELSLAPFEVMVLTDLF